MATPDAEVDVTVALATALVAEQHPDLSLRPLTPLAHGWDNELFRLGGDLLLRFPRRALAAPLVEHEQRWLPLIADRLPVPVPAPVRIGRPALGYPWRWSVNPWLPGTAALTSGIDPRGLSEDLVAFIAALHRPAPADAPRNPYRGVPLRDRTEQTLARVSALAQTSPIDVRVLRGRWEAAVGATPYAGPPVLLHGDLHAGNLLVEHGRLSAVIDFGDICRGDPATDHGIASMLFDPPVRDHFFDLLGLDRDARLRARGWAIAFALAVHTQSDTGPLSELGRRTIESAINDWT